MARTILAAAALAMAAVALWLHPIPQPLAYHQFADARAWLGIPNFLNVLSNLPFVIVGAIGLFARPAAGQRTMRAVLFSGVLLTGLGSAWYHWAPSNGALFWDRLPMAIVFMALFDLVLWERLGARAGAALALPLLLLGIGSVVYWRAFDDLRPYLVIQLYPLLAIPLAVWLFPPRYSGGGWLLVALALYLIAKLLELADAPIFALGGVVSGHTLKHLVGAGATLALFFMLRSRRELKPAARDYLPGEVAASAAPQPLQTRM